MTNIYVGNLSYRTSESELRDMFAQYGDVQSASIVKERDTGRSKGFGFVEMSDSAAAKKAIEAFNDKEVGGRPLRVNEARPREERPQGERRNNGGNRW
ncbi:RNA recognition motif domain-containing protein [Suttonella ornithocola]|uniref:Splicing factor, CC1-like family n=1 Tax=Suttonella ornithocola TaxID=279832 RepID=A0A380MQQ9_9GAMM|nr:RNA-binding protein [Suttonella ornithocola]SUO94618.1 splicing factor, CC1-like family [Suttonella ornithocola]